MKKILSMMALATALASCSRENPFLQEWNTPYGIPPFDKIELNDYIPALKAGIEQQNAEVEAILANPEAPTFDNVIGAYEHSGEILSKVVGVLFNLSETDNSPEMEAIMDEALPLLTEHDNSLSMNPDLYAKVKAVFDADQSGLTREQQMVLKKHYEGFTRSGIGLPAAEQEEMKEINLKLAAAQQKFGNNLLAENNAFKEKFGIPISSYTTEMTTCADRDRREAMFRAYSSRGSNGGDLDNHALCLEILRLRARKAEMLGFPNFAAYQLDNKMAKDPVTVDTFLAKIMGPAVEKAKREVYDMQQMMDADVAAGLLPAGSRIQPWDWFYYAEKVRAAKYALDESQTAPYFKLENVRDGVFKTAEKVYGIQIEPLEGIQVYHPEVEVFKVSDADGLRRGPMCGQSS